MNRLVNPVPVRFSERTRIQIRRAASRFNLKSSDIIRQAVDSQLLEWERAGVLTINAGELDRAPSRKSAQKT